MLLNCCLKNFPCHSLSLSFYLQVTIIVQDKNDNRPQFQDNDYFTGPNAYAGFVAENATVNTFVLSVAAKDLDTGSNGEITYRFLSPTCEYINSRYVKSY